MTEKCLTRPSLIRNASWAIVWDGSRGHVYRTDVDVRLADGRIAEIAPGGTLKAAPDAALLEGRGFLLMPGLVDSHSHPSTEPSLRGIREDHGVPEQYMTGLHERSQAFRLDAEGRKAATVMAYAEMLSCGITTVADLSVPFAGWTDAMREVIQDIRPLLEQADVDRDIAAIVNRIGNTAFHEAYNKGHSLTIDEAVEYALNGEK